MRLIQSVILVLLACSAVGSPKESTASLIAKYKGAVCLPSAPRGRDLYWDTTVLLRDGSNATVRGTGFTGGDVVVSYPATGQQYIAAKPYDYVYPLELRVDTQNDILYVVANGLAGGIREQTWFFVFDLRERRQIERRRIHYKDLPAKCPGTEAK